MSVRAHPGDGSDAVGSGERLPFALRELRSTSLAAPWYVPHGAQGVSPAHARATTDDLMGALT